MKPVWCGYCRYGKQEAEKVKYRNLDISTAVCKLALEAIPSSLKPTTQYGPPNVEECIMSKTIDQQREACAEFMGLIPYLDTDGNIINWQHADGSGAYCDYNDYRPDENVEQCEQLKARLRELGYKYMISYIAGEFTMSIYKAGETIPLVRGKSKIVVEAVAQLASKPERHRQGNE